MIDDKRIGSHLNNMSRLLIEAPEEGDGVLTSDSPVVMSNGLGVPEGFLMIPTSQRTPFLPVNQPRTAKACIDQEPKAFFRAINDAVVRQADRLVIGHSKSHRSFVEKRLGHGGPSAAEGMFRRMIWKAPIALAG